MKTSGNKTNIGLTHASYMVINLRKERQQDCTVHLLSSTLSPRLGWERNTYLEAMQGTWLISVLKQVSHDGDWKTRIRSSTKKKRKKVLSRSQCIQHKNSPATHKHDITFFLISLAFFRQHCLYLFKLEIWSGNASFHIVHILIMVFNKDVQLMLLIQEYIC